MRTIRGRLATWYAVALGATMLVFAIAIYAVQRRQNFAELDAHASLESELIAAILGVADRGPGSLAVVDPETGRPELVDDVATTLEVISDYVIVADGAGEALFLSADARALPYASLIRLLARTLADSMGSGVGMIDLGPPAGETRYFVRSISGSDPGVAWVLSGASTVDLVLGPQRLLSVMIAIAPLIILSSTLIGYFLAGRTLQPLQNVVDEVEAITDGRSLHRRLVELKPGDELARLAVTLNAMLGRLERNFRSLRRFTADASHELKTPLTVLRSGIERAVTHPKIPPEALEVLEETLGEVNQMAETVDSLLMLARADEGRAPLHLEQLDLREILQDVAETGSILGEQAGVDVEVRVPEGPMWLAADQRRIRQLLMNLLTNAIKYTPAGGNVEIDAAATNGTVALKVRDTGMGIAPGDLPHIFDRFWRADEARSRTGARPGSGLGLAICKWIAEAHGGTIVARSRPGRGTTFSVTLPTVEET